MTRLSRLNLRRLQPSGRADGGQDSGKFGRRGRESRRFDTLQLVFFDLDGTITRRDTLFPYVMSLLLRRPWRLPRLLAVLPTLLRFATGRADHGELKGQFIRSALGGLPRSVIAAHTARWVPQLLARGVFADALRAIDAHRSQQDHLVLMSASVDLYVPVIGAELGFDTTVCSTVRWNGDRLLGTLTSANVRDAEKVVQVRRLRQQFPEARAIAYGNSMPDVPHLDAVDQGWCVNASGDLRSECERRQIHVIEWH
jgi:HAD superfamily hydrolase (TIGR01490 family)